MKSKDVISNREKKGKITHYICTFEYEYTIEERNVVILFNGKTHVNYNWPSKLLK